MSYTKEPWHVFEGTVQSSTNWTICDVRTKLNNGDENARRIVACINALQGVPTEQLEQAAELGITNVSMGNLFSNRLKLQQQRDELLAVVKYFHKDCTGNEPSLSVFYRMCDEVLAKIEGGAR